VTAIGESDSQETEIGVSRDIPGAGPTGGLALSTTADNLWLNTNLAQPEINHSNKTRVKTDRFRMQTLRTPRRRAGCAPLDAPSTRRLHVAGRASCAPEDALGKRAGARGVCASVRAGQARQCARSTRVGARGARASVRA